MVTSEKKAFSIFHALRKGEEYLRDVKFTLQIDHLNVNVELKSKSRRENLLAISILAVNINTQLCPLKEFTAPSAHLTFSMWMNTFGQPFSP